VRAVLVTAGIGLLAIIGYAAGPRALASSAGTEVSAAAPVAPAPRVTPAPPSAPALPGPPETPAPSENAHAGVAPVVASPSVHVAASPDDPVVLNVATIDEFRRLPGIGEKRAAAMVALRERLGRFRAVEDLLKVKGIGRAMLKRIRPLVRLDPRLDPRAALDAGH
jgi:competence protein ComEA